MPSCQTKAAKTERMDSATDGLMASFTGTFSSGNPLLLVLDDVRWIVPAGDRVRLRSLLLLLDGDEKCVEGLLGTTSSLPLKSPDSWRLPCWTGSLTMTDSMDESGLVCVPEEIWTPDIFWTSLLLDDKFSVDRMGSDLSESGLADSSLLLLLAGLRSLVRLLITALVSLWDES